MNLEVNNNKSLLENRRYGPNRRSPKVDRKNSS
jgi:hypothetical protein